MEQGQEPVFQMPGFDPAQLMFKNNFSKQKRFSKLQKSYLKSLFETFLSFWTITTNPDAKLNFEKIFEYLSEF